MKISDVKRQGLAVLSRRLGLTRRRRLGRADFKFKLTLLSHCRLNGVFDKKREVASKCAVPNHLCAERLVESLFLLAEQDSWSWTTCKFSSGLWACGAFLSQSFASDPSWYIPRLISPNVSETAHWIYILRLHYLQSIILDNDHY